MLTNPDQVALVIGIVMWLLGAAAVIAPSLAMHLHGRVPKPKPYRGRHRPKLWTRLADAYLAGAREMAAASAMLRGVSL